MDTEKLWRPRETPEAERNLLTPLPFPFLADEVASDSFVTVSGVKILGAPKGSENFVACFLCEQMAHVDDFLSAVEEMSNPHIYTEIHRLCASVVKFLHIFRATRPAQIMPLLKDYYQHQQGLTNVFCRTPRHSLSFLCSKLLSTVRTPVYDCCQQESSLFRIRRLKTRHHACSRADSQAVYYS